ncbi:hypothetical protein JL720_13366 [Aureococcus anophagefferens]|nr:hypothetical protein JL720_13366 [Aureococcus anophagefferens]
MVEPLAESPPGPQLYDAAGLEAWLAREGLTNESLLHNIHEQVEHLYDLVAADPEDIAELCEGVKALPAAKFQRAVALLRGDAVVTPVAPRRSTRSSASRRRRSPPPTPAPATPSKRGKCKPVEVRAVGGAWRLFDSRHDAAAAFPGLDAPAVYNLIHGNATRAAGAFEARYPGEAARPPKQAKQAHGNSRNCKPVEGKPTHVAGQFEARNPGEAARPSKQPAVSLKSRELLFCRKGCGRSFDWPAGRGNHEKACKPADPAGGVAMLARAAALPPTRGPSAREKKRPVPRDDVGAPAKRPKAPPPATRAPAAVAPPKQAPTKSREKVLAWAVGDECMARYHETEDKAPPPPPPPPPRGAVEAAPVAEAEAAAPSSPRPCCPRISNTSLKPLLVEHGCVWRQGKRHFARLAVGGKLLSLPFASAGKAGEALAAARSFCVCGRGAEAGGADVVACAAGPTAAAAGRATGRARA